MKKLILILAILLLSCKAQERQVEIDPVLWGEVQNFIEDSKEYEIDLNPIRDSLEYITVLPLDENLYGLYTPKNKQISINFPSTLDEYILRKVVYHELGHVFGVEHESGGIMSTNLSPMQIHLKYCPLDNVMGEANWELEKMMLFREIKEIQYKAK